MEPYVNSFILAGALTFGSPQPNLMPDRDALRYISKALYKELGLDAAVSRFEKKYIKLDRYPQLVYAGIIVRGITENKITYRWEF